MREGAVVLSPSHVSNLYPNPFINPPRINLLSLTSTYLSIPPLNRLSSYAANARSATLILS